MAPFTRVPGVRTSTGAGCAIAVVVALAIAVGSLWSCVCWEYGYQSGLTKAAEQGSVLAP